MISLQEPSFSHMLGYWIFFGFSDKFCIFLLCWAWFLNNCKTTIKREPNFEMVVKHRCHSLLGDSDKKTKQNNKQKNETIKWLKDASHLNYGCHKLCTKNSFSFCISKIVKFRSECGGINTQHALPMLSWIAVSSYSNSNYCGNYETTYDSFLPYQ